MKKKIFEFIKRWLMRIVIGLGSVWLGIIVLLSIFSVFGIGAQSMPDEMILRLKLTDGFNESGVSSGFPFRMSSSDNSSLTIHEITQAIRTASNDDRVKGIVLSIDDGKYGYAHIQEFHDAIKKFQETGKSVYSYATGFGSMNSGMSQYYLSSVSNEIWMQPIGTLNITGFSMQQPFFKKLLDKIGIVPEIIHRGDYKSAPEPMLRSDMSPQNKEMSKKLLNAHFTSFVVDIAKYRNIKQRDISTAIDNAPLLGREAVKYGFITKIGYKDQFIEYVNQSIGNYDWVDIDTYVSTNKELDSDDYIAVINVDGIIAQKYTRNTIMGEGTIDLQKIIRSLEKVADDSDCRGIVMRVNSPGGAPDASEELRRSIVRVNTKKPVVVSMGNVATSGGYWIGVNARSIVAQPLTLTGSIGVFGGKIAVEGLLNKLGISIDGIQIGENADIWSFGKRFTPTQRKKMVVMLDEVYDGFVERVAFGRGLSKERVEKLAQGRVYTGQQAFDVGLVDSLGGIDVAINELKSISNIKEDANIMYLPKPNTIFDQLMDMVGQSGVLYQCLIYYKGIMSEIEAISATRFTVK